MFDTRATTGGDCDRVVADEEEGVDSSGSLGYVPLATRLSRWAWRS